MRIALIVTGGLHPSGREQVIPALLALVKRIAQRHEVHAFALRHLPERQDYTLEGARIHDLGRPEGRWKQWRAVRHAMAEFGPFDVVHGYWADPAGVLAVLAGRRLRIPSVVTCASGEFVALPSIGYGLQRTVIGRRLVSFACRRATIVHVTSDYMHRLARQYGIAAERIPLGVELSHLSSSVERVDGPPWRLLQVASLNPVKDQTTLLEALAILRRTRDVRLDLIGEDTMNGRLQDEAAALGVQEAVTFHGFVPHDRIAPFFHRAHIYVQSSRHEAAGIAVLEAAAAGLPIVGTRVGFVSDWHGTAALGVTPGVPEALAAAIELLVRDGDRRMTLAHTARQRATEYDADRTAAQLEELFSRLGPGR